MSLQGSIATSVICQGQKYEREDLKTITSKVRG